MPGPLSQWDARRRRGRPVDAVRVLPAAGRQGPPPPFPEQRRLTKDEQRRWTKLWSTPQAEAWADLELFDQVARLMRMQVAVDRSLSDGSVKASMLSEIRQLEAALGLSPMSLARLHWSMEEAAPERSPAEVRPRRLRQSAVDRVKAIDDTEPRPRRLRPGSGTGSGDGPAG
jgi:hypothetical protein